MKHVVSFSGGRSSAYLLYLMEERRKVDGLDVTYIFMDTGAEHPKTYEFIRNIIKFWGVNIIVIRVVVNPKLGSGNGFEVIDPDEMRFDLSIFRALVSKLGTFTAGQSHCTRDAKQRAFEKYIKSVGLSGAEIWLGMRYDEPSRLWGAAAYSQLRAQGLSVADCADAWVAARGGEVPDLSSASSRVNVVNKKNQHYLAEISDFEKSDVLEWWSKQPFDLEIEEHLGNCVFCVKKNAKKIALAVMDEPELALAWRDMHIGNHVRTDNLPSRNPSMSSFIYMDAMTRRPVSMDMVIASFSQFTRDELYQQMRFSGGQSSGSCSESCEVFK